MSKGSTAKLRYQPGPIQNFFRKAATVLVFPFAFVWFFVIYYWPSFKKLWNPEPIKVYILGTKSDFDYHGKVKVIPGVRYKKQRVVKGGGGVFVVAEGMMQNANIEYAFRVDRPELLRNPSVATIRAIKKKFEELGYEVRVLTVLVDNAKIVHVL